MGTSVSMLARTWRTVIVHRCRCTCRATGCASTFTDLLGCENDKTLWARSGVPQTLMQHCGGGADEPVGTRQKAFGALRTCRIASTWPSCAMQGTRDASRPCSELAEVEGQRSLWASECAVNRSMSFQRVVIEWVRVTAVAMWYLALVCDMRVALQRCCVEVSLSGLCAQDEGGTGVAQPVPCRSDSLASETQHTQADYIVAQRCLRLRSTARC